MEIIMKRRVARSADAVWQKLGPEYARAGDWASSVFVSKARNGTGPHEDAPCAGRVCETSLGPFTESLEVYDPDARRLAYSATGDKMPGFMRRILNTWAVNDVSPTASEITLHFRADIAPPFNVLMGWLLRRNFNKVLGESLEEFVHYVETGRAHPRKRTVDASKRAAAARAAFG